MTAGIKANVDGSAAIQVGGTDVITLTSGGAATFVTSPTTVQAGTAAAPSITFSGDTNTGIYSPGADQVAIATGGTAAVTVTPSQNVGIGTSSPGYTASNRTVLQVNGSSQSLISLAYGGTNAWYAYADVSNTILLSEGARNLTIGTVGAAPQIFTTNNTERARFNASAPILCLSGGNTSATGTGIAFPATQSASSDANTLDDYEEGSWTPSIGGNATYTLQDGRYVKIGNFVMAQFRLQINARGTGSQTTVSGLPFASENTFAQSGATAYFGTLALNTTALGVYVVANAATFEFVTLAAAGGTTTAGGNVFQNSTRIDGVLTYRTP